MASPFALWHLLSLDAPTVAALWTWFIARLCGVELPMASPVAMALAVWVIYATDRLLDARRAHESGTLAGLEARHFFHDRHRHAFAVAIAVASVGLGALLSFLDATALRLYILEGALLAGWFAVLHATRAADRLPKEIAVGIFFSAAVFIPTVAREPAIRVELAPAAVLLGVLCALNCLFIYAWEHEKAHGTSNLDRSIQSTHPTTRFALRWLTALAGAALISGVLIAIFTHGAARPLAIASALSAALLLALDRNRSRLSRTHLRAAADLALLTPAILAPLLPMFPR